MDARVVLRLVDVVKAFPGVIALKGVSLEVVEGEVHALLGENGAGKSTLMAVAAGAIAHDSGTVEIGGAPLTAASPSLAQSLGISVVYQHTSVLDDLTVAENLLYCVRPERRAGAANERSWIEEQLAAVGALFDKQLRVRRALGRRAAARRDRQSARFTTQSARSRRADGIADRYRDRAPVRQHRADHRTRHGRLSTSRTGCPR